MKERDEKVEVDPQRNTVFVPGSGNLPMIGLDRAKFDQRQKQFMKESVQLRRMMMSKWRCVGDCREKLSGATIRPRKMPDSEQVVMTCPNCGGAVVIIEDALSLTGGISGR